MLDSDVSKRLAVHILDGKLHIGQLEHKPAHGRKVHTQQRSW